MKIIENLLRAALYECCPPLHAEMIIDSFSYKNAQKDVTNDLIAFSQKDPSSSNDLNIIAQTITSFSAVLHYRLAHNIYFSSNELSDFEKEHYSYLISQRGKLKSGAEINFKAKIGKRFTLDHGYGTVFGDTTVIGNDCYILGGVILGAKGISQNPSEPRHPIIGDNTQIGSFAKIFGKIHIGDNVFIGSDCTITEDVISNSRVVKK